MLKIIMNTHVWVNTEGMKVIDVHELRAVFTRPNPEYGKRKAMGMWLGNTSKAILSYQYEEPFLILPRGMIDKIEQFLEVRGYELEYMDDTIVFDKKNSYTRNFTLRDDQVETVELMVQHGFGVFRAPPGFGKTIMLMAIIEELDQPTLVIVHNKLLMRQWLREIRDKLKIVPGVIGGGKKDNVRHITVGMQQTITRRKDAWWCNHFGCIVGDEVHHWAANTFRSMTSMFKAKHRIGASADERRKDRLDFLIRDTFGPTRKVIKHSAVKKRDSSILPVKFEAISTDYFDEDYYETLMRKVRITGNSHITRMLNDEDRIQTILRTAINILNQDEKNKILVLFDRVAVCKNFLEQISNQGYKSGLMVGGYKHEKEGNKTVDGLRFGDVRIGVATTTADEGIDIPALTHILVTSPKHKNPKKLEQIAGRTSRWNEGKTHGTCVYFWDWKIWPGDNKFDTEDQKETKCDVFLRSMGRRFDEYTWKNREDVF